MILYTNGPKIPLEPKVCLMGMQQTLQKNSVGFTPRDGIIRRKRPNAVGEGPTVGVIFSPQPPIFSQPSSSFHPTWLFLTALESGDKTKNTEDEFKTV